MSVEPQPRPAVSVTVSDDRMTVRAHGESSEGPVDAVIAVICEQTRELGTTLSVDDVALHRKVSDALSAEDDAWDVVVLQGTPPKPPVDERLDWKRDFFATGFKVDPVTGRIDYRERAACQSVETGEVLVEIIPGEPGEPGLDVFGKTVPPQTPKKAALRSATHVAFDETAGRFTAARPGRVRLSANTLYVDDTLEINGSVGLETGNIKTHAHLIVHQDIEDLAVVKTEGGIEVANVIGAATVTSGGDLIAARGIAGAGKSSISVDGVVQAGYISNADIRARAGVTVLKEILQSDVRTCGDVTVEEGRIVGGKIVALGDIVIGEVGSGVGVPTLLIAGEDYTLATFLAEREAESEKLRATCDGIRAKIDPLIKRMRTLTATQRKTLTELASQIKKMESRLRDITEEIKERTASGKHRPGASIRILRRVHPCVTFQIHGQSYTNDSTRMGPLTARLDDARYIGLFPDTT